MNRRFGVFESLTFSFSKTPTLSQDYIHILTLQEKHNSGWNFKALQTRRTAQTRYSSINRNPEIVTRLELKNVSPPPPPLKNVSPRPTKWHRSCETLTFWCVGVIKRGQCGSGTGLLPNGTISQEWEGRLTWNERGVSLYAVWPELVLTYHQWGPDFVSVENYLLSLPYIT